MSTNTPTAGTEIEIDAMAKAAHDAYFEGDYDGLPDFEQEMWRNVARAVLDSSEVVQQARKAVAEFRQHGGAYLPHSPNMAFWAIPHGRGLALRRAVAKLDAPV